MLSAAEADLVQAYSADVSRVVRRAMLDAIPDGEPHRWLYRVARDYPSRQGKGIRPALCLATSRAFGKKSRAKLRYESDMSSATQRTFSRPGMWSRRPRAMRLASGG